MSDRPLARSRVSAAAVLALLAASVACFAVAPLLMPDSYSIVENAISESAAQAVESAWLARAGFLLFGFGVLLLARLAEPSWGLWGRLAFVIHGVALIAAAAFSHMPWEDVPYDVFEDFLHSIAASTVGAAFTIGVLLVSFRRGPGFGIARVVDLIAIVAAITISMAIFNLEEVAGLVQRVMFAIAYLWFGMEAIRGSRDRSHALESLASGQDRADVSTLELLERRPM